MIKRILIASLAALNVMTVAATANTLNDNNIDSVSHDITIGGQLEDGHGGLYVNLYVRDKNDKLVIAEQTKANDSGVYSFTFNCETSLSIGGEFTYETVSQFGKKDDGEFTYYKVSEFEGIVAAINGATQLSDIQKLWKNDDGSFKEQNIALVSFKNAKIADVIKSGKTASLNSLLFEIRATVTTENVATVIDKIYTIISLEEAQTKTDVNSLLTADNIKLMGLEADANMTAALADTNREYFEQKLAESQKQYLTQQDLLDDIRDCYILTLCSYKKGPDAIGEIITKYADGKPFDLRVYNSAGNDKYAVLSKIDVARENKTIKLVKDIQDILDVFVAVQTETNTQSGSSGGNRGGGSSGVGGAPFSSVVQDSKYDPTDVVAPVVISFKDLGDHAWAEESIKALAELGIVNGVTPESYEPQRSVTRAELCKMVCGVFDIAPKNDGQSEFGDVAVGDWHFGYVKALADKGIVTGTDGGNFSPNVGIIRQDVAVIVYRVFQSMGLADAELDENDVFADHDMVDEYAKTAVSVLKKTGIVEGNEGNFNPKDSITRAEVAKLIYEVYKYVNK